MLVCCKGGWNVVINDVVSGGWWVVVGVEVGSVEVGVGDGAAKKLLGSFCSVSSTSSRVVREVGVAMLGRRW